MSPIQGQEGSRPACRRQFTSAQKVVAVKRHLVEKEEVSAICVREK